MSRNLRIALLGSYPTYRIARALGIEGYHNRRITSWNETLADALALQPGCSVHFISRSPHVRKTTTVQRGKLNITFFPVPKLRNLLMFNQYACRQVRSLLNEISPDIVHGIGTEHIWPSIAVRSGFPSIITVHGVMTEITRNVPMPLFSKRGIKQRHYARMERRVLSRTKHLITINPYVEDVLGKHTSAHTYLVENPVREEFFSVNTNPGKGQYFLFVGSLYPLKGLHYLVEALQIIRTSAASHSIPKILLVGPESDREYCLQLRRQISDLNLEPYINFHGFALPDDIMSLYSMASALVLPSLQETAPMCIAEAMAARLPVIATNVGGIRYMIKDGHTGMLIPSRDSRALAGAIDSLHRSPYTRADIGEAARAEARKRWLPEVIASKTIDAYKVALQL